MEESRRIVGDITANGVTVLLIANGEVVIRVVDGDGGGVRLTDLQWRTVEWAVEPRFTITDPQCPHTLCDDTPIKIPVPKE